jgi:ABC-type molybdate transport system permease subunit
MIAFIENGFLEKVLVLSWLGFFVCTLIDLARGDFKDQSTKVLWLLLVLFIPAVGMLLYWFLGRQKKTR